MNLTTSPFFCRISARTIRPSLLSHHRLSYLLPQEPLHVRHVTAAASPVSTTRRTARPSAARASLRRVIAAADRSRPSDAPNSPWTHHGLPKKTVTAYCQAEQYNLTLARRALTAQGYTVDPIPTGLESQVLHVLSNDAPLSDIFIFPSGTIAAWNVPENTVLALLHGPLLDAAQDADTSFALHPNYHPKALETEDLEYVEDASTERSSMINETIRLGTLPPSQPTTTSPQLATLLTKIAFSSGLARSTKLATLETSLDRYFTSTRSFIPSLLSHTRTSLLSPVRRLRSRSLVLAKTSQLFALRAQLNLDSELTDRLPDLFWDARHELGLEAHFEQVARALDIHGRIRVLNERMTYALDIAAVLRERLSEQHGFALEWLIIVLISIEVGFEVLRLWRERERDGQSDGTTVAK